MTKRRKKQRERKGADGRAFLSSLKIYFYLRGGAQERGAEGESMKQTWWGPLHGAQFYNFEITN